MKKIILRKVPYLILMISVVLFTGACSSSEEERIIQEMGSVGDSKIPEGIDPRTIEELYPGRIYWGKIKEYYKDNKLVRIDYYYYKWAKLRIREYYKDGLLHGTKTTWKKEGQIDGTHSVNKRRVDDFKNYLRGYKIPIGGLETETEYVKGVKVNI